MGGGGQNKNWLSGKLCSVLRENGVALALVDHVWMPRPRELFEIGDPLTADFAYVRWIGDRKGIEERTKVWDRTIVDRTEGLREWVKVLGTVSRGVKVMFAFANNHYGGHAPDTVDLFKQLWAQEHTNKESGSVGSRSDVQPPQQRALDFR